MVGIRKYRIAELLNRYDEPTQRQMRINLAAAMGISVQQLHKYSNAVQGKLGEISMNDKKLNAVAAFFGISLVEVFNWVKVEAPPPPVVAEVEG